VTKFIKRRNREQRQMASKRHILVITQEQRPVGAWRGLKEICSQYGLPYHTLKGRKYPIFWNEWSIFKFEFRKKE